MKKYQQHTAILIFSRSAREEAVSKCIGRHNNANWNFRLYQKMIAHTVTVAEWSKIPVFVINESRQRGICFGDRLWNAFSDVFSMGFQNVISIGNDCPLLNKEDILKASQLLDLQKNVIGPAMDGGTYLIGLTKKAFDKMNFTKIPWDVVHMPELVKQLDQVELLEWKSDIDSNEDLLQFVSSQHKHYLWQYFRELLFGIKPITTFESVNISYDSTLSQAGLRAPPTSF